MKRLISTILLILGLTFSGVCNNIYWILFVDTSGSLGQDNLNGKAALEQDFIIKVNEALAEKGYNSKKLTFTGDMMTPEKCDQVIQQLSCGPKDIVIFYYIGHGGRPKASGNAGANPWPEMEFAKNPSRNYISLQTVHNKLKAKNPRLLLTVGMCCNVAKLCHGTPEGLSTQGKRTKVVSKKFAKLIQDWFLSCSGDAIIAAASPGEVAYGGMMYNNKEMDFFTGTLCMLMNKYSSFPERAVTWERFLSDLAYWTNYHVKDSGILGPDDKPQHPKYKNNITQK